MPFEVLPGRECGACHVCCQVLTIDSPEFQKHGGCNCRHARADKSCGIYPDRYQVCREFQCGWRLFKWVRPSLRPDLSGVLTSIFAEPSESGDGERQGIIVTLLNDGALEAEGLAETVAAAISAGAPVMVSVPGLPAHQSGYVGVTDEIRDAVRSRDKKAVLEVLRHARTLALSVAMQSAPVTLNHGGAAEPAAPE